MQHLFDFWNCRPDDGAMTRTSAVPATPSDSRRDRDGDEVTDPAHPRWTHAPLGALVFVVVFDAVSAAAGSTRPWARELYRSGTFVLSAAPVLIAAAMATGLLDRARATIARTPVRARVNLHAVVMVVTALASAGDLAIRRFVYPDARHTPGVVLGLSAVALVAALVGGDLGGRLTYRAGVGVHRRTGR
jgi:uncharacterized membrane protein